MNAPYRQPRTSAGLGKADQDPARTTRLVFLGAIGILFVLLACLPSGALFAIGALATATGDSAGGVFFVLGSVMPVIVVAMFLPAVAIVALLRSRPGAIDSGWLRTLASELGGLAEYPTLLRFPAPAMLRTRIDEENVTFVAHRLPRRSPMAAMISRSLETKHARLGVATIFGPKNVRVYMYTNHRVPYKVSILSRSRVAGWGTSLVKMREVPLPAELSARIACYATAPERVARVFTDHTLLERCRALVESNYPFLSHIRFEHDGVFWMSLATDRTHAEAMAWRFREIRWIAGELASA